MGRKREVLIGRPSQSCCVQTELSETAFFLRSTASVREWQSRLVCADYIRRVKRNFIHRNGLIYIYKTTKPLSNWMGIRRATRHSLKMMANRQEFINE